MMLARRKRFQRSWLLKRTGVTLRCCSPDEALMSNLPMEVVEMLGQALLKVVPVTIALALVFTVLAHFWSCNPGKPWWRKRELVTDVCYWFFVPLFARVFRIGLLVVAAGFFFNIHDADELVAFFDNGSPIASCSAQAVNTSIT